MRKTSAWGAAAGLVACGAKLFTIHVEDSATTEVPRGTLVEALLDDVGFDDFVEMDLTTATELQNQGVEPGDIREVTLDLFELEATDPPGADLSFLESMELWVEAEGLPPVLVASAEEFPEGVAVVTFDLETVDLTPYVVSEAMTFSTVTRGHRPAADTTVEARFDVAVGVTGQGACNQL